MEKANRRSVVAGLGSGLLPFRNLTQSRKRNVVVTRNASGPVETQKVTKKWWKHRTHAHKTKANISQSKTDASVVSTGLTRSDMTVGRKRGFNIRIVVENKSDLSRLPNSVNGFSIDTELSERSRRLGCFNDGQYNSLVGGVYCSEDSETDAYAMTTAMAKKNGSYYLLTCWHMHDSDSGDYVCGDAVGEPLYNRGQYFGDVAAADNTNDWALVDVPESDLSDGILTSEGNTIHPISAWFTKAGIDTACSDGRTMIRQGVTSGYDEGLCKVTNSDTTGPEACMVPDYGLVFDIDSAVGNSGGPIFSWGKNDPDNAVVAGHVSWGSGPKDYISACGGRDARVYEDLHSPLFGTISNKHGVTLV